MLIQYFSILSRYRSGTDTIILLSIGLFRNLRTNWIKCIYYYCRFKRSFRGSHPTRVLVIQISSNFFLIPLCRALCVRYTLLCQIIRITFQGGIRQSQTSQIDRPFHFCRYVDAGDGGHLFSFPVSVFELIEFPVRWNAVPDISGRNKTTFFYLSRLSEIIRPAIPEKLALL